MIQSILQKAESPSRAQVFPFLSKLPIPGWGREELRALTPEGLLPKPQGTELTPIKAESGSLLKPRLSKEQKALSA